MSETTITDEELAEMKELCDAATPGPWTPKRLLFDGVVIRCEVTTPEYDVCANIPSGVPIRKAEDVVHIAHARTDWPRCIAEIERQRTEIERLKGSVRMMAGTKKYLLELAGMLDSKSREKGNLKDEPEGVNTIKWSHTLAVETAMRLREAALDD